MDCCVAVSYHFTRSHICCTSLLTMEFYKNIAGLLQIPGTIAKACRKICFYTRAVVGVSAMRPFMDKRY